MESQPTYTRILNGRHVVNGRILDCNIACKRVEAPKEIREKALKKMFVGGLPKGIESGKTPF